MQPYPPLQTILAAGGAARRRAFGGRFDPALKSDPLV